ncbi:putative arsenite efflux transporter ArsB [Sclerotinia borealis F-4128]|uniref:Putative arsenite efflux transporter ArsB n=1 Tax=Sclerotinia borealis (strain F-4128) TaxID=1432307 RepID=W9CSY4_SCLBF|nr:putative arsenite efflux transporter ArsB [Sclerotinia borealis F-4128]
MAAVDLDTNKIKDWRSIVTLIIFVITNLFLLAILAIGREEVHDGTVGANSINPIDIMVFFITLAYIAISIDASGLIRFLAFKVLQKGGKVGHRLFFFLYAFFFCLGTFIGNDPIILSGTAFLAYLTRVSSNIIHPRAWIFTQFAIANIASAILVSSNPTNLVLAGAFGIKFIAYTANMIVPVVVTAIVLFPFLLYIVFADEALIPFSIKMHELSEEAKAKKPVNPNIPNAKGNSGEEQENELAENKQLSLEEIMNPFVDRKGAAFGAILMTVTLITVLVLNAVSQSKGEHPVFWVTLPAAFVMFVWDISLGWINRHETREIARKGRHEVELARAERAIREEQETDQVVLGQKQRGTKTTNGALTKSPEEVEMKSLEGQYGIVTENSRAPTLLVPENFDGQSQKLSDRLDSSISTLVPKDDNLQNSRSSTSAMSILDEKKESIRAESPSPSQGVLSPRLSGQAETNKRVASEQVSRKVELRTQRGRPTLVSLFEDTYLWSQETFPTVTAVVSHLPFALVPFAFSMFVLVQALVTKGWVPVFAYGWDHWVNKTGTVGAIGGMGFLSCILCNFAGTNIGTTILLCRVIQAWQDIHHNNGLPISDRVFWGTVYSMAIGVNYGAFSTAFSASLAGLLWRDILGRKHIHVRRLDFARVNLPIIAISMAVGCAVLVGQIYVVRTNDPYDA